MSTTISSPATSALELVFVPHPFSTNINSMLKIANLLADRYPHLSFTIFIMHLPFDPTLTPPAASAAHRQIRFVHLPPTAAQLNTSHSPTPTNFFSVLEAAIQKNKQPLRDGLADLIAGWQSPASPRLAAFVVDMFCTSMMDVANGFGVPTYVLYGSAASLLTLSLHLHALRSGDDLDFVDLFDSDTELVVPTFTTPIPARKVLPSPLMDKAETAFFRKRLRRFSEAKGILVNSFAELEPRAVEWLQKPGADSPPIYPVGPLLNPAVEVLTGKEEAIISWLDEQPPSSVVFLCFGSGGCFDAEQVREIARGLERSGHRFLWSLRRPPPSGAFQPGDYSDPAEVLPEGFLRRTAGIGMLIGWAPQVAVLAHRAVGGFVSHCGWNSVVESVWFGVPIATWPMYAEQQMNAFLVARELGMAEEITVEYRRHPGTGSANFVVSGEEVERGIRCVMEQDSRVRKRVKEMMEKSRRAIEKDGSSYTWLGRFVDDVIGQMAS